MQHNALEEVSRPRFGAPGLCDFMSNSLLTTKGYYVKNVNAKNGGLNFSDSYFTICYVTINPLYFLLVIQLIDSFQGCACSSYPWES